MNNVIIKGRLARDPETKTVSTKNGESTVCSFTVAVDRTYGEGADFFNCQAWGKTGEIVDKFFKKGKEILASGAMECDPFDGKDGKKQYPWRLKVNRIEFCGSKNDSHNSAQSAAGIPDDFVPMDDDDLPF